MLRNNTISGLVFIVLSMTLACDGDSEATESTVIHSLRFGHGMSEDSTQQVSALRFARLVEERTGGRVRISVHPAQSLGNDHEMVEMARAGTLDIIALATGKLSTLEPAMQLVDLPYLFPSREVCHQVLDGDAGLSLLDRLNPHGLVGAGFWEAGFKQLTANQPVRTAADLHGLRFRTMRSEVLRDQFDAWGANSVVIEFAQTREALADGVVDGQESPISSIHEMRFYEAQSHLMLSQHGYSAQVLAFSKQTFDGLPSEVRVILMDTAREVTAFQREEASRREARLLQEIRASGTEVIALSGDVRNELRHDVQPVLERMRMEIGTAIFERFLQAINQTRSFGDDELVLALDADLAGNSALSGLSIRRGAELAIDEINEAGGVLGKSLVLHARDNSMIGARGLDNLRRFAEIPQLVAVLGGISSPVALAELDFIHDHELLYLDPWAAATNIVDNGHEPNFVFRVSVRDALAGGFLVSHALDVSPKVALLLVNNGWGRSNHHAMVAALETHGIEPESVQWFDWGDETQAQKVDRIYQSGAEVILFVGNAQEGAAFVREIASRETPLPVISHWGVTGGAFPTLAGEALERIDFRVLQTFSFIENQAARVRRVVDAYHQKYGTDTTREIVAPVGTAHAYDLVHLLARAMEAAGTTDPAAVRAALERLEAYDGLIRRYDPPFTSTNHDALRASDYILARYDGGSLVPWSDENPE